MKDKSPKSLAVKTSKPYSLAMAKHTGIRKLPNGRFRARYFAGCDSKGKRKYPAKTFNTQSDAIRWRSEQVSAKTPGHIEAHGQTVSGYLDQWLAIKKQSIRENSHTMYRQVSECYLKPALGHIRLTRLSPSQVEEMQADLLTRVSATTVNAARMVLHGALKKARRLGLIRVNPVDNTDGVPREKPQIYPMTIEEALRLITACEGMRHGLFFILALNSGLRPEELIGLQWSNVELGTRGVVRVKKVIHHLRGGGWRWHEPKSKSGVRSVVVDKELAAKLEAHRKLQLEQRMSAGKYWKSDDLVFCNGTGEPLRRRALREAFKAILVKAKLPTKIRVYDCRHFFVTSSLLAGVDAKTVSQEAGHSKVSFTLDTYGHVLEEMHEAASDMRAELMKRRTKTGG